MIIDHGFKSVKMSLIRYRPDIREYQLLEKVKDMARSIEDVGLLHPIILRYGTKEVIAGHHRSAACLLLKKDTIKAHVVECSDVEAQFISMVENAHRNHNSVERDAAMEALVELHLECQRENEQNSGKKKKGKKDANLKQAFQHVAGAVGLQPRTIERRHYDRKKKKRGGTKVESGINTLGMEVTKPYQVGAKVVQKLVWDVSWHIKKCVEALNRLDKSKLGFPIEISDKVREDLRDSSRFILQFSPTTLCPYCKGLVEYQKNCRPCYGYGWVGKYVTERVIPELMDDKNPCILIGDDLVSLHDQLEDAQPEAIIEEEGEDWK